MERVKKTIFIAIFVSLAAQIRFNFLTEGFIVAMSVLVMAVFIYSDENLSPLYIAVCSGIFSPLIRMGLLVLEGEIPSEAALLVVPDVVFFFSYGIFYTLIYKYAVRKPKTMGNFSYVIFCCDFLANVMELLTRSVIHGSNVINLRAVVYLLIIAVGRTLLIRIVLMAMDTYSRLQLQQVHEKEYRRLMIQASIFESELYVMEKNAAEIEEIMRQAFSLYKAMENIDAPKELKNSSLDISKNAHEIKGDYLNIIDTLKDTFVDDIDTAQLRMSEIIGIEKRNLAGTAKQRGYRAELTVRQEADFGVKQYFKMMSVVRNLLLNSAEALGKSGGKIVLTLTEEGADYVLKIRDDGPGIGDLEAVFFNGYSTKFNEETGNVQRGLGLPLVKDYIENSFGGTIEVFSEKGKYTEFVIRVPKIQFEEAEDEVLHH